MLLCCHLLSSETIRADFYQTLFSLKCIVLKLSHLVWDDATGLAKCPTTFPFIRVEEYHFYGWRTKQ